MAINYENLCKPLEEKVLPVQIGEYTISVRQYLPIQEKLELIGRIIDLAHDENYHFENPMKIKVFMELETVRVYSDIEFPDEIEIATIYDQLNCSGVLEKVLKAIPFDEFDSILTGVHKTVEALYKYQNSALGILEVIKNDYANTEFNVEALQKILKDMEDSPLIKEIAPLMQ